MQIRALRRKAPRIRRGQRGQVAVILAFLITFLILMLGLVTDSVRLFILSTQAIRAAEAGALAGALYMPNYYDSSSNPPSPDGNTAVSRACAAVKQNGITNCPASVGQDGATPSKVVGNPYELQVTVTLTADVFFLDFVLPGLSNSTVSRSSVAQFLPPIQLGSRSVYFGDQAESASGQQFWARINGPYEIKENGDAFTPIWEEGPTDPITYPDGGSHAFSRWVPAVCCTNHQQWPAPILNPDQQPPGFNDKDGTLGYNYEIVVPAGVGNVQVKIFNPAFEYFDSGSSANITQDDLGSACDDPAFRSGCKTDRSNEYLQMHYSLFSAPLAFERSKDSLVTLSNGSQEFSPPSLDLRGADDSANGCGGATPYWDPQAATCVADPGYVEGWYTLATLNTPGTYRLVVAATGYYGEHSYAIKLTDTAGNPAPSPTRMWAWGNECVYFSTTGATSTFDLGEIPAAYAGKTLNFSLFDPGDGSGTIHLEILDPSGNPVPLPAWVHTVGGSGGTILDATGQYYNGLWLHIPITIPTTYNPAAGSDWWQVVYLTSGTPTDTVTISISLSGSPVHLISEVL